MRPYFMRLSVGSVFEVIELMNEGFVLRVLYMHCIDLLVVFFNRLVIVIFLMHCFA